LHKAIEVNRYLASIGDDGDWKVSHIKAIAVTFRNQSKGTNGRREFGNSLLGRSATSIGETSRKRFTRRVVRYHSVDHRTAVEDLCVEIVVIGVNNIGHRQ
jgi:hypothetical protein